MVREPMFELKHRPEDLEPSSPAPPKPAPAGPGLSCLRGAPGPADLSADVTALCGLPSPLQARFYELLAPYLAGTPSDEEQQKLFAICEEHGFDAQGLVGPIRGARFLVHNAARAGLDEDAFGQDVARLVEGKLVTQAITLLLPCFRRAAPELRRQIVSRTIADHGRVVTDVSWRVDKIIHSEHGDGVNLPVALLTFRYQDGSRDERVTLHLLPDQLAKLKAACLELLPDRPQPST
jgi:hypothetical protein